MSIKIGGVTLHITLWFAVFFAVSANVAGGRNVLLSFLFSFIHEAVHLVFLHFFGCKNASVVLMPAAVKINCEGLSVLSNKKTAVSALSAPVFNILTGAVFYCMYLFTKTDILNLCAVINFILGISNLFPLSFLDGGRALSAVLSGRYDENKVHRIMTVLSVWSVAVLFAVFFMGCIAGKTQMFLLFFCIYCLAGTISDRA